MHQMFTMQCVRACERACVCRACVGRVFVVVCGGVCSNDGVRVCREQILEDDEEVLFCSMHTIKASVLSDGVQQQFVAQVLGMQVDNQVSLKCICAFFFFLFFFSFLASTIRYLSSASALFSRGLEFVGFCFYVHIPAPALYMCIFMHKHCARMRMCLCMHPLILPTYAHILHTYVPVPHMPYTHACMCLHAHSHCAHLGLGRHMHALYAQHRRACAYAYTCIALACVLADAHT